MIEVTCAFCKTPRMEKQNTRNPVAGKTSYRCQCGAIADVFVGNGSIHFLKRIFVNGKYEPKEIITDIKGVVVNA